MLNVVKGQMMLHNQRYVLVEKREKNTFINIHSPIQTPVSSSPWKLTARLLATLFCLLAAATQTQIQRWFYVFFNYAQ